MNQMLATDGADGLFLFRVWRPEKQGPSLCVLRADKCVDITSKAAPTMRDLLEMEDPVSYVRDARGEEVGTINALMENSNEESYSSDKPYLLAPNDLQAIKACGVTFAHSMLERVIEERAGGDPARADAIRGRIQSLIGDNLSAVVPGSEKAMALKAAHIEEGIWSQYLEVGIGPDAEVFTKSQPLSAVGFGASVGLHPISTWNNPEPEVVLAVNSRGEVKGAALGNDVNLRDVEGRSALLLGKAKDNNASCAIGPFIRLFDGDFTLDTVRNAELTLTVQGEDGFELKGASSMNQISRDPLDLVSQTIGKNHQYPDGFMLFLGTLFAPTQDRDSQGGGFTHKMGDVVEIQNTHLGTLRNVTRSSADCPPWQFGLADFMRNLAARDLL